MKHLYTTVQQITVAALVIRYLELEQVEYVFGIPGGYVHPFLQLLRTHPTIKLIISRHEEGAAFMADGYARTTGKLGVVLATAGPGATNALTGLISAHADGVPLLLITGQTATDTAGQGAIQDSVDDGVHLTELLRHACAFSETAVSAANFPLLFAKALQVAFSMPRKAVHLSIPINIASATIQEATLPTARIYDSLPRQHAGVTHEQILEVWELLTQAQRPVIMLGNGCRQAFKVSTFAEQFGAFVTTHGIGVITSPKAKGIFPESHPCSLGVFGIGASGYSETYLTASPADTILVLGSSLNEWATARWSKALQATNAFIQVNLNPRMLGRAYPATHRLLADVRPVLSALFQVAACATDQAITKNQTDQHLAAAERLKRLQQFKNHIPAFFDQEHLNTHRFPLKPQAIFYQLGQLVKEKNYSFFVDMGNSTGFFSHFTQLDPPAQAYIPYGFSSMGWASGAVIGGRLGTPDKTCICITGDGAFLMNGIELQVAARYHVGVVYIVLFDNYYGMVHHGEMTVSRQFDNMDDRFYDLGSPNLVQFAESLGAHATSITQPGAFEEQLPAACARANATHQPQVLIVAIDHRERPPLGNRFKSLAKQLAR